MSGPKLATRVRRRPGAGDSGEAEAAKLLEGEADTAGSSVRPKASPAESPTMAAQINRAPDPLQST
jgi:hypothetical protein